MKLLKHFLFSLLIAIIAIACYKTSIQEMGPVSSSMLGTSVIETRTDNFEYITPENINKIKTVKMFTTNDCYEIEGVFIIAKPLNGRCNPTGCIIKTQGDFAYRYYATEPGQIAAREIINSHGINEIDLYDGTNGCGPTGTNEASVCHRQTWGLRFDAPSIAYADSVLTEISLELDAQARVNFDASNCPPPN